MKNFIAPRSRSRNSGLMSRSKLTGSSTVDTSLSFPRCHFESFRKLRTSRERSDPNLANSAKRVVDDRLAHGQHGRRAEHGAGLDRSLRAMS